MSTPATGTAMGGVSVGGWTVEFGLFEVGNNPSLTFVFFIGMAIFAVLGLRFAYYAHRNLVETDIESQVPIWRYLRLVGLGATLYGAAWVVDIVSSIRFTEKDGLLLAVVLLLAFAVRQIHVTATGTRDVHTLERVVRAVFVAVVFAYVLAVFALGHSDVTATLEGAGALAFLAYGVTYFHDQTSNARLQGTMLDSLLRQLLPVLTFAALAGIVFLTVPLGIDRLVVLHVQAVFLVMTATAFMTTTIKLQQNLAGL